MKKLYQSKVDEFNAIFLNVKNHKLTFIECSQRDPLSGEYMFKCRCDCGKTVNIRKRHFKLTGTKSCGCIKKGRPKLAKGERGLNQFINAYNMSAKRRNLEFKLTREEIKTLSKGNCFYCGMSPKPRYSRKFAEIYGDVIVNGIDRRDNTKGYVFDNCVSCCKICNRAKSDLTEDDFRHWIKSLIKFKNELA